VDARDFVPRNVEANHATWSEMTPFEMQPAGATSIWLTGMRVAVEVLTRTAVDLFTDPGLIRAAREESERRIPEGFEYRPLLGGRDPPLDYRGER
jgi:aminobenzoyl-glutamate utilization protein B